MTTNELHKSLWHLKEPNDWFVHIILLTEYENMWDNDPIRFDSIEFEFHNL